MAVLVENQKKRKGAGAEGEAKDRRPYIRTKAGRGGVRGKAGTSFFLKQIKKKIKELGEKKHTVRKQKLGQKDVIAWQAQ